MLYTGILVIIVSYPINWLSASILMFLFGLICDIWLVDVPDVQAVHPVGWDPEEDGGGQRYPTCGVAKNDEENCAVAGGLDQTC